MSRKLCLIGLICGFCHFLKGQTIECPRFFHLNVQRLSPSERLISQNGKAINADDDEPGVVISSKLLFPISLKGKTKIVGQLNYGYESVYGLHYIEHSEGEYLSFHKLGLSLIAKHKFNRKWSYLATIKVQEGAERLLPVQKEMLGFSTTHLLQKKIDKHTEVGFGVQASYNQTISILPVFKYEKELWYNWKIDVLLPSKALVYKKLNLKERIYAGIKGSRGNYYLNETSEIPVSNLFYRRLNANVLLGYETQLKGMLGFMIEGGANIPIRDGLYTLDKTWESVHDYQKGVKPYIRAGIYLAIDK